jgi:hypothetical protein
MQIGALLPLLPLLPLLQGSFDVRDTRLQCRDAA